MTPVGGRLALRAGYNVLAVGGGPLRQLLDALIYPDQDDGSAILRSSRSPGSAAPRGGITLVGNDGTTYRLVREFGGSCQLHRFDPQRRSFALLTQDLAEISEQLRELGVPTRSRFEALLSLSASELLSKRVAATPRAAAPVRRSLGPEQTRKRLTELKEEFERAQVAEKLQYQLDGLQSRLFKIEELLKAGEKIRDGLEAAQAARGELKQAAQVLAELGDVDARLAAFEKASAKREEGLVRATDERAALDEIEDRGHPEPFWQDRLFLAGAGAGILAIIGAAVGYAMGGGVGVRYLALLDVPAFGVAGWSALRWVRELESRERAVRRRKMVNDWERKLAAQYEHETAGVREVMKVLDVKSLGELKEIVSRVADADAVVAEWHRRKQEWEEKSETRESMDEKERVEDALHSVEQKLATQVGGYIRDPRSIEAEMSRLETELASPFVPEEEVPVEEPAATAADDPFRDLVTRAAAELSTEPAPLVHAIQQRVSQLLGTLTAQRIMSCLLDEYGDIKVHLSGKLVTAASLPSADGDACYTAIKLTLIERSLANGKLTGFIDEALASLPEGGRRMLARMLKQIARPGQLLHATADPVFRDAADHAA